MPPSRVPSRSSARARLPEAIFRRLLAAAGPRGWWPGEGRDEIVVGAVLTQNTAWRNVELAIGNLRGARLLSLAALARTAPEEVAPLIRPAGYYNLKARRLRAVADFFAPGGVERFDELAKLETEALRAELLRVRGVGPETADSILLYALDRLSFVVDAYTIRIMGRHGVCAEDADYHDLRDALAGAVPRDVPTFNEFHALLVWAGNRFCKPTPRCEECPLREREFFATAALARAARAKASASGRKSR